MATSERVELTKVSLSTGQLTPIAIHIHLIGYLLDYDTHRTILRHDGTHLFHVLEAKEIILHIIHETINSND